MSNAPKLAQLQSLNMQDILVDQIEMLLEELAAMKADATRYGNMISSEMARRYSAEAAATRSTVGKDTGTVRMIFGDHVIVADSPKEVKWDQAKLATAFATVSGWEGEDPTDYVKVTYGVDERKFTAWPKSIQKIFEPARTVKTGKATFKIEAKKEAA